MGPLPHPEVLRGYEQLVPGAAGRIIEMAEEEGRHRRALERDESSFRSRGQIFAAVIALAGIGSGTTLVASGQDAAGFAAILVPIGTIVAAFLWSRRTQGGSDASQQPPP